MERKEEIILAVREFLERKNFRHGNDAELTDEQIWMAAESPLEYDLFHDFFDASYAQRQQQDAYGACHGLEQAAQGQALPLLAVVSIHGNCC